MCAERAALSRAAFFKANLGRGAEAAALPYVIFFRVRMGVMQKSPL